MMIDQNDTFFKTHIEKMSQTPQNPEFHGEGDVWSHTQMVCESLVNSPAWQALDSRRQKILYTAALLHDIGKTTCTREENGTIVSPNHSSAGEKIARKTLWLDFGLCGTYESMRFRESVCSLIRHHSKPFHFYEVKEPERTVIVLATHGELVQDFTNEMLGVLVEADMKGRITESIDDRLEHLYLFLETAKEAGCLSTPFPFPSPFSRYAYLSGRDVFPGQELYNDTWGSVIMLAGLPGTGKDTYIKKHYPDLPMVSLDNLRKKMGVSPTESQWKVANAAKEQAKDYLRKKQPFVWNATNITPFMREKQIGLFKNYNASVKIVYLETEWDTLLSRNKSRENPVPETAIESMAEKLIPPNLNEAHEVEWVVT